MSKEMREQINRVKNFGQFLNEGKREKIFLNGYEMWLDRDKMMIFDKEDTKNGIHFDIAGEGDGISIFSQHLTKDEKRQLLDYIKYGR
jgi:hypothetical protein